MRVFEDNILFNVGKGFVFINKGIVEMEVFIMDGRLKNCGVVFGIFMVVYFVLLVCLVMDNLFYVYFVFDGVEEFVR